jgi:hypothetical protein
MSDGQNRLSKHWLYWSPGNSARVNEIVDHLTPAERRTVVFLGGAAGGLLGLGMGGLTLVLRYVILDLEGGMTAIVGTLIGYGAILCLLLHLVQQHSSNFLKNTAWSREQSLDKAPLPLKVWHREE